MKTYKIQKNIYCILAVATLLACAQEEMNNLPVQAEMDVVAMKELPRYRTYEEALAVAQEAIGMLDESSVTRSGKSRTVSTADVQYITKTSSTRSDGEPDTLMYVFNYEDNAGFAVVSANRATEDLIAVTEQGNYVAGEETGNGGFDLYMDIAEEYVMRALEPIPPIGGGGDDDGPIGFIQYKIFTDRDTTHHEAYINVSWGQNADPYNRYCPTVTHPNNGSTKTADAGCLAIALAGILSHLESPSSIKIDFDNFIYTQSLDWNAIKRHKSYSSCNSTCTNSGHEQIALLCRQLGKDLGLDYTYADTGDDGSKIPSAINKMGLSVDAKSVMNFSLILSSLASNRPVLMLAEADKVQNGITYAADHAWVVDGYTRIGVTKRECIKPDGQLLWTELSRNYESYHYLHCNWGWNGDCNGYFSSSVINPSEALKLDEGSRLNGYYDFDFYNFYIYTNIR